MTRLVLIETLVFVLLTASAAQAQLTTSIVKVHITGDGCDQLENVRLVINGNDFPESRVRLKRVEGCEWEADLGDATISTSTARFSLRAGVARSDCQKAAANEKPRFANLHFSYRPGTFRNVSVKIEPSMPFSYVRKVPLSRNPGALGVPCTEQAMFPEGEGAIGNTDFSGEDVYLHLWPVARNQQTFGLLLDKVVSDKGPMVLGRHDVAQRLTVQRAQGKGGSAPTLSSNAIDFDLRKLAELKFERARIEVIK